GASHHRSRNINAGQLCNQPWKQSPRYVPIISYSFSNNPISHFNQEFLLFQSCTK
ncbi:unnamed protein product, partial [Prunus brigantina]